VKTTTIEPAGEGGLLSRPAGWWANFRTFLAEVRNELKRVTWPSRKEVYATTLVVILVSIFFGVYLWGVDMILAEAVQWVFRRFGGTA
jgi:preprotein translocase subunit SecE